MATVDPDPGTQPRPTTDAEHRPFSQPAAWMPWLTLTVSIVVPIGVALINKFM
ncbi:hypothetical protein [Paractinoplanes ferrugineus]|uniref:hypothetical protein n=1 Tax=Paractinoplanes ferrugineus TaxID=113564 RepID=UPI001943BEF9|nr:hypothetical protein [Actinoplanes ferrugineus]